MGIADQEHLAKLTGLLPTQGRWRWLLLLVAIPTVIGAGVALLGYSVATVHFYDEIKYAISVAPSQARTIDTLATKVTRLYSGENEVRDTLGMPHVQ